MSSQPKALVFDVFGTCVDWRLSIAREGEELGRKLGKTGVDWLAFADAWRARYQPQMETVRSGQRPWTTLDVLHREALDTVLPAFGLDEIPKLTATISPAPGTASTLGRMWSRGSRA